MLQLENNSPFECEIIVVPDPDGIDSLYTIIKATFCLGPTLSIADEQLAVVLTDEFVDDPQTSSLTKAADGSLIKPGTDVLLVGTAYAAERRAVTEMDVSLNVGPLHKTLRVFGDRVWKAGILREKMSDPQPIEKIPLTYENAFGGVDSTADGLVESELRNSAGVGFRAKKSQIPIEGTRLPNIEDPARLISRPGDRPSPAGFGPICAHWEPRRGYAGTYDEDWQKHRAPYLPKDFDPRFFQLAPEDQVVPDYLKGGEEVEIVGATPAGRLKFRLPEERIEVTHRLEDEDHVRPANLDTVLIEPDESRLVMIWRSVFPCDKKALQVREIEVALASSNEEA